jgi:hypothetical protein
MTTNIDAVIANLSKPDSERDWASEIEEAFRTCKVKPDAHTLEAAKALNMLCNMLVMAVIEPDTKAEGPNGNYTAINEDGTLSEGLASAIRGGAFIAAIARNEEKDSPIAMTALIVRGLVDDNDKTSRAAMAKRALDNIRKGVNVVPEDHG